MAKRTFPHKVNNSRKILIYIYVYILILSQWLYAIATKINLDVLRILSSLFLWSLIISAVFLVTRSNIHLQNSGAIRNKRTSIVFALRIYLLSLIPSCLIALIHENGIGNFTEGFKIIFVVAAALAIVTNYSQELYGGFKMAMPVLFVSLFFGLSQVFMGVGYFTKDTWLTFGAEGRWWNLNAIWGTMAYLGKNAYGLIVALCLCIIIPFASDIKNILIKRLFLYVIIPLSFFCVFKSQCRTALICSLFVLILEFFYRAKYQQKHFQLVTFMSIASISLVTFLSINRNIDWIFDSQSITARSIQRSSIISSKFSDWIIGSGFNGIFRLTKNDFGDLVRSGNSSLGVNVDNSYLRTFLEGGIIGISGLLLMVFILLKTASFSKKNTSNTDSQSLRAIRYLTIVFLLTCFTADFTSFQTTSGVFFFLVAIMATTIKDEMENENPTYRN